MTRIFLLCIVSALLFTTGCYNKTLIKPNQAGIDAYIQQHPDLSALDKSCIEDARFEVGMNQETVRFLLGEPKKLEIVQQPWAKQEKWTYKNKRVLQIFLIEDKGVVAIEEN